jgi:hypothetical protein
MGTAEKRLLRLDAVPDDLATAVVADRGQLVNGAFKAVERVGLSRRYDLERQVVIVSTDFTSGHTTPPEPDSTMLPTLQQWQHVGKITSASAPTLEKLYCPLVLLRCSSGLEGAKVAALAGSRVLLPGVEPVLTSGKFPNHSNLQ